jgi:hypothetical protein
MVAEPRARRDRIQPNAIGMRGYIAAITEKEHIFIVIISTY